MAAFRQLAEMLLLLLRGTRGSVGMRFDVVAFGWLRTGAQFQLGMKRLIEQYEDLMTRVRAAGQG